MSRAMREFLETAREASLIGGRIVARAGHRGRIPSFKGATDLVTATDRASERAIQRFLSRRFPAHGFVGEEGGRRAGAEYRWIVDPLDGTTNFAHGHPFFAVSIALCDGREPLVGVVVAPALNTVHAAARGLGAERNGEPCEVAKTTLLADALGATGFPYDRATNPDNNLREFAALKLKTRGVRRCGSAALDLCLVADGTYGFYWEQRLAPWDLAAGACIVAEAGGRVTDWTGAPFEPRVGQIAATNGPLHDELLAALRAVREGAP
ncbi:MAG: inositol monophosphatase [Candidatus Brocadiae bacterium]|nr:inositol monophosphatase [Candidatus Brocadiia bacterium]